MDRFPLGVVGVSQVCEIVGRADAAAQRFADRFAERLAEYVGEPIEIRFYKPAASEGAFVWLDEVQLRRGDQSHEKSQSAELDRKTPEGD